MSTTFEEDAIDTYLAVITALCLGDDTDAIWQDVGDDMSQAAEEDQADTYYLALAIQVNLIASLAAERDESLEEFMPRIVLHLRQSLLLS